MCSIATENSCQHSIAAGGDVKPEEPALDEANADAKEAGSGDDDDDDKREADDKEEEPDRGPEDQIAEWHASVALLNDARARGQRRVEIAPPKMLHGVEFNLLLFPNGNNDPRHLGAFLAVTDRSCERGWSVTAAFQFTLLHRDEKHLRMTEEDGRLFSNVHKDWGFWKLGDLPDVLDEASGFVWHNESGEAELRVTVRLIRVEPPLDKRARLTYDSRAATGLVGLENQGATCYLNSLLQSLYHLPAFRRAVYSMDVHTEEALAERKTIPLALQRLFYQLDSSPTPVKTRELTKSFGWNSYEAFTQHDVQEMLRVLTEALEEKMKGEGKAGSIQNLFRGEMQNYIEVSEGAREEERRAHKLGGQLLNIFFSCFYLTPISSPSSFSASTLIVFRSVSNTFTISRSTSRAVPISTSRSTSTPKRRR